MTVQMFVWPLSLDFPRENRFIRTVTFQQKINFWASRFLSNSTKAEWITKGIYGKSQATKRAKNNANIVKLKKCSLNCLKHNNCFRRISTCLKS